MSGGGGGGGDPPLTGGEFLLSLLQKSHNSQPHPPQQHHSHLQQQQQYQYLHPPPDPAVGAGGPIGFRPRNNEYGINWSQVQPNFFIQDFNQGLWRPVGAQAPGFVGSEGVNSTGNTSILDRNNVGGGRGLVLSVPPQQEAVLRFGSYSAPIVNGNRESFMNGDLGPGNVVANVPKERVLSDLDRNGVRKQQGSGPLLPPSKASPPGFADAGRGAARMDRKEKNVSVDRDDFGERIRSKTSDGDLAGSGVFGGFGISRLDHPGPSSGSKLHLAGASDVEESMCTMHTKVGPERRYAFPTKDLHGDNEQETDALNKKMADLLGGDDDCLDDNAKKLSKHRHKDVRSDTRGHQILNQRMRNYKRQLECRADIFRLDAPLMVIYESLIPSEEERTKQKQLLSSLERLVNREWPDAKLYIYGSCANSFGVSKSDIDICFVLEGADNNKPEILLRLAEILESDNLKNVQALVRARVPIVKLMDPSTEISCDICINNVLAVVNTKLLRDYARIDARLRQLAFIVKHWAKSRRVNETYHGTLSSYAYVLMCIHFLQQRRPAILPCLQGMKTTYSVTIENVQCAFFDRVDEIQDFGHRNSESISQLVWSFFNYWAYGHDYANSVISVRTGRIISKRGKDWTRRIGNDRHLICIEDPFETSHDLGRVVDKYSIKVLREEFERAAEVLQHDPDPCVKLFEPYAPT